MINILEPSTNEQLFHYAVERISKSLIVPVFSAFWHLIRSSEDGAFIRASGSSKMHDLLPMTPPLIS